MENKAKQGIGFHHVWVPASDFVPDSTYPDFPFKASICHEGIKAGMVPTVAFSPDAANSRNYAPMADCVDGAVIIYAKAVPDGDVLITTFWVEYPRGWLQWLDARWSHWKRSLARFFRNIKLYKD